MSAIKSSLITILALTLLALSPHVSHATGKEFYELISELERVEWVSGEATGYGAQPGQFFLLYEKIMKAGNEEDFIRLTMHSNPVIRVMGLLCLANIDPVKHKELLEGFYKDVTKVGYQPFGCVVDESTVGEIARQIVNDPRVLYLEHWDKEDAVTQ